MAPRCGVFLLAWNCLRWCLTLNHGIHHHQGLPFARICLELFPSTLHKSKFGDVKFWPNKWRTSWLLENVSLLEPPPCQMVFSSIVFFDGVFLGQHMHVRSNNRRESESFLNAVQSHVFEVRHSTLTACRSSQWLLRLTQLTVDESLLKFWWHQHLLTARAQGGAPNQGVWCPQRQPKVILCKAENQDFLEPLSHPRLSLCNGWVGVWCDNDQPSPEVEQKVRSIEA